MKTSNREHVRRRRGLLAWALVLCCLGCAGGRSTAGVVLHQTQSFPAEGRVDTVRIYITPEHVRVQHAKGDAIIDVPGDRLILVDPQSRTFRQTSLAEWERHIREAVEISGQRGAAEGDAVGALPPRFEPAGAPVEIAGHRAERFVLYNRRELLPGDAEYVEQQIWVTTDLELPAGAYEAYDRATRSIESIGLGGFAERPRGVVLQSETRIRPAAPSAGDREDIERSTVFRIERADLADSLFQLPAGFAPADARPAR